MASNEPLGMLYFSIGSENWAPATNAILAAGQGHFCQGVVNGKYPPGVSLAPWSSSWVLSAGFQVSLYCRHGTSDFFGDGCRISARFVEVNHNGGRWPWFRFSDFDPNDNPAPFIFSQSLQLVDPPFLDIGIHFSDFSPVFRLICALSEQHDRAATRNAATSAASDSCDSYVRDFLPRSQPQPANAPEISAPMCDSTARPAFTLFCPKIKPIEMAKTPTVRAATSTALYLNALFSNSSRFPAN